MRLVAGAAGRTGSREGTESVRREANNLGGDANLKSATVRLSMIEQLRTRREMAMNQSVRERSTGYGASTGRQWPVVAAAMILLALVVSPLQAAETRKPISDGAITSAVESELLSDEDVSPNPIDVAASHGVVTLSGSAGDLLARRRAVRIAESTRGVLGVVDDIAVAPVSRPDEAIREDVVTALHRDPATESYPVTVAVKDGVVTLTGSVGSWAEGQLAARIAEEVRGVKDVDNGLAINYAAKRTDAEIAADITDALDWDVLLNGYFIKPVVQNGRVMLGGAVGSVMERSRAIEDTWVNGVVAVDATNLKVEPWAREEVRRRRKRVVKSDPEIRRAVQASLRRDPRVSPFSLNVAVEDGVVILDGAVTSLKAKTVAEQDARGTVGVLWVDDLLRVRPSSPPSDTEAERDLKAAVRWNPLFDGCQIDIAVINHAAYLGGWVDSAFQRAEAQDIASRTKGVLEVRDHLKIWSRSGYALRFRHWRAYAWEKTWPPSLQTDAQIKRNIERAFFWSPFVDRDDIAVTVHDGVVTLTGLVDGWLAYGEADRDARASGAIDVRNRLAVKPGAWF